MISASNCQTPYKKLTRIVKGPIVNSEAVQFLHKRLYEFHNASPRPKTIIPKGNSSNGDSTRSRVSLESSWNCWISGHQSGDDRFNPKFDHNLLGM